jgi:PncC family amidohydrolase
MVGRAFAETFFHMDTGTFSYVVYDEAGGTAAIVDPVLDYDAASARTATESADALLAFVEAQRLRVEWILETHAHADHLSAGGYLRGRLDAPLAIGRGIVDVQARFKTLFGLGDEFVADGHQFDRLFDDGDTFGIGHLDARVLATPGHTGDSLTYVIGDAAFIGDTLFAPEIGTARCDFPGGDARRLYASIRAILALPPDTRLFLCHDYPPATREPMAESSIAAQARDNIHVGHDASADAFVAMRTARDAILPVPRLLLPALQVNIRGGRLPEAEANGVAYLKLPLNLFVGNRDVRFCRRWRREACIDRMGARLDGAYEPPMTNSSIPVDAALAGLAMKVGEVLKSQHLMLVTAESCTGGWIAKTVTDIAGSSDWFDCGLAAYSYEAKQALLGVRPQTLEKHGAVSRETVLEMVSGAFLHSGAGIAVSVTGIAGPGGGTEDKPVGTVWVGWKRRGGYPRAEVFHFDGDREAVRRQTVLAALQGLLDLVKG